MERSCRAQVAGTVLSHALFSMAKEKGDVEGLIFGSRKVFTGMQISDADEAGHIQEETTVFVSGLLPFEGPGLRDAQGRVSEEWLAACVRACQRRKESTGAVGRGGNGAREGQQRSNVIGWFRFRRNTPTPTDDVSMYERAVHDALGRVLLCEPPLLFGLFVARNPAPTHGTHTYEYAFLRRKAAAAAAADGGAGGGKEAEALSALFEDGKFEGVPTAVFNLEHNSSTEYTRGLGGLSFPGTPGSAFTSAIERGLPEQGVGGVVSAQLEAVDGAASAVACELRKLSQRLSDSAAREDALRRRVAELRAKVAAEKGGGGGVGAGAGAGGVHGIASEHRSRLRMDSEGAVHVKEDETETVEELQSRVLGGGDDGAGAGESSDEGNAETDIDRGGGGGGGGNAGGVVNVHAADSADVDMEDVVSV